MRELWVVRSRHTSVGTSDSGPSLSQTKPAEPLVGTPSRTAPAAVATVAAGGGLMPCGFGGGSGDGAVGLPPGVAGRWGPTRKSAFVCANTLTIQFVRCMLKRPGTFAAVPMWGSTTTVLAATILDCTQHVRRYCLQ